MQTIFLPYRDHRKLCIIVTCLHIVTIIRLHVQTQMEMHGWLQQPALLLEWLPPLPARW